jgi:16S rRNA C967 or C1407 C5-methylase (RsmB/RsmF family)
VLSGLLDWALPRAAPRGLAPQVVPHARLLACHLLSGEISVAQAAAALPFIAWDTIARARTDAEALPDPVDRVQILAGIPRALAAALCSELGAEALTFARALHEPAPVCIRANALRIDRDALRARLQAEGVATAPTAVAGRLIARPARRRAGCRPLQWGRRERRPGTRGAGAPCTAGSQHRAVAPCSH